MQRFYFATLPTIGLTEVIISKDSHPEQWHQLKNVLRSTVGSEYVLFSSHESEFKCRITTILPKEFVFTVIEQMHSETELDFPLTLMQALPQKSEKWEWILQKGTELGVTIFEPLITQRTQRHALPKNERMAKILIEAIEQSGRTMLPQISPMRALSDISFHTGEKVFFASLSATKTLQTVLEQSLQVKKQAITLIVGPEGGFTPEEETHLLQKGAIPYSLGKRTLRLETAAIASLGIISQLP